MTGKEKDSVARAIAAAMRSAAIPVDDDGRPLKSAREEIAMHLGDELADLLGTDAERMVVLYDVAGMTAEVRRG